MASAYEKLTEHLLHHQRVWLITGVAGFIGSNLLHKLLSLNQVVIGLDNFATGFKKNLNDVLASLPSSQNKNFYFHEGDICSFNQCDEVVQNVDYVLHQAALGSVTRSLKTPELTHATNTSGFLNMLIAAKNKGVKRFVYASSSSVYGDSQELPKEEHKIGNPLSPYAVSKYTNELYAKAFSNCYHIETIGLRYFNVFGPYQDANGCYAAVIPCWIKSLSQNEPLFINGDGETSRDFCYIENVVQANLLAATTENKTAVNTVYNIAVGEQHSLKTLYHLLLNILKLSDYQHLTYQDFRPGDIRHSLANIDRAKALLGYQPMHKLKDGLKKMVDWFLQNPQPMTANSQTK